jgi:hypothetical protein
MLEGSPPMEFLVGAMIVVIQFALAGFLMWGGWLCLKDAFLRDRASRAVEARGAGETDDGFERVASLVLLALLCTTLIGAV